MSNSIHSTQAAANFVNQVVHNPDPRAEDARPFENGPYAGIPHSDQPDVAVVQFEPRPQPQDFVGSRYPVLSDRFVFGFVQHFLRQRFRRDNDDFDAPGVNQRLLMEMHVDGLGMAGGRLPNDSFLRVALWTHLVVRTIRTDAATLRRRRLAAQTLSLTHGAFGRP